MANNPVYCVQFKEKNKKIRSLPIINKHEQEKKAATR